MILGLGGNDRLLHPCQKLLRLRQRQPQIRDLAKVVGPADLQHLDTPCPAVDPRFDQLQNPPHPRSPSRQRPDRSYRFRPYPPGLWTLPISTARSVSVLATAPNTCRPPAAVSTLPTRTSRCRSPSWQLRMKVESKLMLIIGGATAAGFDRG